MGTFFAHHPKKTTEMSAMTPSQWVRHWRPGLISSVSVASQTWVPWPRAPLHAMRVIWKGDVYKKLGVERGKGLLSQFFFVSGVDMRFSRVNHPFSRSYPIMNPPISQNIPIDYSGWCFGFREFWMTFQKPLGISASNASELSMILKRGLGEKTPTSTNQLWVDKWITG